MPTRNSLSLISLGTPTSMGLTPQSRLKATREGYRRKLAVGTLALALHLSLCYKQGRLAAALEGPRESARIQAGTAHELDSTAQTVDLRGRRSAGFGIGQRRSSEPSAAGQGAPHRLRGRCAAVLVRRRRGPAHRFHD